MTSSAGFFGGCKADSGYRTWRQRTLGCPGWREESEWALFEGPASPDPSDDADTVR